MNLIAAIILIALLADFILNLVADILNLGVLGDKPPEAFADVYDADDYTRSQEYLRTTTRFGWVVSAYGLALLLGFWFGGGFPYLDGWARGFGYGPILTGLIFIGVLMAARGVLSLPFGVYRTFVIEERFGFNRTTWQTFLADMIKGVMLGLVLGTPLLVAILAFFEYFGPGGWWGCWIAATLFMIVLQFIAPTWILPLFNKFTPVADGELKDAVLTYARSIGFPLQNVFVMDGSKRSNKSNAFFTGFGRNKRIALFDTLIEQLSVREMVAVLAHEMGHYKKKHIRQSMTIGILQTGTVFFLLSLFLSHRGLFDAFYMEQSSVYAGLIFFGLLYAPLDFFMGLILQAVSRRNEYAADRFVLETGADGSALIEALKKLSVRNLSNLTPHPFYVFLNYSHPPVLERIRTLESRAGEGFKLRDG